MTKRRAPRAGAPGVRRRKHRARPVPRWLKASSPSPDGIARRRCVLMLSVLSGERPVSDAIKEAGISRPTYYQMETRAINAMLAALDPRSTRRKGPRLDPAAARIAALTRRIASLEQDKRRMSRLLLLTRRAVRPEMGLATVKRARLRKRIRLASTRSGGKLSRGWVPNSMVSPPSTSTKPGEDNP